MPSSASVVTALLAAGSTTLAASFAVIPSGVAAGPEPSPGEVTMVHANIKSALTPTRFQSDVAEVLAGRPDVVTYNEVPERLDSVLAPDGYALHRLKRNRYTRANAVAWRTDRWTAVDSGTRRISNYRDKPPGRNVRIGLRFANWVTLQSADGHQMSVVAAHVAPLDRNMPDLLRRSVRQLRGLAEELAPRGPVLFGGDFNVHYKSGRYPRALLDSARMVPTYDTLGTFFPTGDHHGMTIDYVFNRGAGQLEATSHRPIELYSDHDAIVAELAWTVDAPGTSERVVSDPGSDEARWLAVDAVLRAIRGLEPGQEVTVVSSYVSLGAVRRQLGRAVRRDVHVTLLTRSKQFTRAERRLARLIRRSGDGASAVTPCRNRCLRRWRDSGMAATFLLARDDDGRPVLRIDASRRLDSSMLRRRTRLWRHTGSLALSEGERLLAAVR